MIGQAQRALALADELEGDLGAGRPVQTLWCHAAVIIASIHSGRTPLVLEHAEKAQAVLDQLPGGVPPIMRLQEFLITYFQAMGVVLSGTPPGPALLERCEALAARSGKLQDRLSAILPPVVSAALRGRPGPLSTSVAEADGIIQRLNHPQPLTSRHKLWLPVYYLDRGELELCRAVVARIRGYAERSKDAWLHTYHGIYQGLLLVEEEAWAEAEAVLTDAVHGAQQAGLARVSWAQVARARARLGLGRHDDARADVEEALALCTAPETWSPYDEILCRRVKARLVEQEQAEEERGRALALAVGTDNPIQRALVLEERAAARRQAGDARADDDEQEAQAILAELQHPRAEVRDDARRRVS